MQEYPELFISLILSCCHHKLCRSLLGFDETDEHKVTNKIPESVCRKSASSQNCAEPSFVAISAQVCRLQSANQQTEAFGNPFAKCITPSKQIKEAMPQIPT